MNENIRKIYEQVREVIIVLLLFIWITIPVLKEIRLTYIFTMKYECIFMNMVGFFGILFLIIDIYINATEKKIDKKYLKDNLPIIFFAIFMMWTFISCIYSPNKDLAIWGTNYRKEGYITYMAYAGFFLCAHFIKSEKIKKNLINMLVIMAILNIILVLLYNYGIFRKCFIPRIINMTSFSNRNHYGYYLLLASTSSIFLFITDKNKIKKLLYLMSSAFLLYYLILNDTFGCIMAIAVTIIFFFIYSIFNKKINKYMVLTIVILGAILFTKQELRSKIQEDINILANDVSKIIAVITNDDPQKEEELMWELKWVGTKRGMLWKNAINFFWERPILGYGPENLESKYAEVGLSQDRPHNLLIQLATTSGIIGLVTYVTAVGIIWARGIKKIKYNNAIHVISFFVVTAYLISAMFGNSMYYTSPYFFIFLGLLMRENRNKLEDKEK